MNPFMDRLKKATAYDTWAGQVTSATTRYHHRLAAPPTLKGFRILTRSRPPGTEPALDWIVWNLAQAGGSEPLLVVHVREYASIEEAHRALLAGLGSITRPGLNLMPREGGPGDVCILTSLARDNLVIEANPMPKVASSQALELLRELDGWLLCEWPRRAAQTTTGLLVTLSVEPGTPSVGRPLGIRATVQHGRETLDLLSLPHRFWAAPGRMAREPARYVFTPTLAGKATLSLTVLGPGEVLGQAELALEVLP